MTAPAVSVAAGLAFEHEVGEAPESFCARVLDAVFGHTGKPLQLSVHFATDAEIAALHEAWLGDPSPTDVISFPLGGDEHGGEGYDGELVIGYEHARRIAYELTQHFAAELALYLVHGTLHLCGYDDHDAADLVAMKHAERCALHALGFDVHDRFDEV